MDTSWQPIGDHALLSDCNTAALVDQRGSIEWWCPRRFDASSTFARILDPGAGHFSITPRDVVESTRSYLDGTMVLERRVRTPTGSAVLTDALDLTGSAEHDIGRGVSGALLRTIEVVDGAVTFDVEFAPRPDYGSSTPELRPVDSGTGVELTTADLRLTAPFPLHVDGATATAIIELSAGQRAELALAPTDSRRPPGTITATIEAWRSWDEHHRAAFHTGDPSDDARTARRRALVRRSAMVLQALTFQPTGAIVAAPTTSLPEKLGGESNWDYRYGWLRDTALVMEALSDVACADELLSLMGWITAVVNGDDDDGPTCQRIVFGIDGETDLHERELSHLRGHRNSAPVRVGNDAWRQRQLDVTGEVLDAAWGVREHLPVDADGRWDSDLVDVVRRAADVAASSWREPDSGIWEGREGELHYTSSKVLCWVALDRAAQLGPQLGADDDAARWATEAERVRADIFANGWNDEVGAFTGAYGSEHLDASVLLMPLVGFLPADDERMRATILTIAERLTDGGLVVRWNGPGGRLCDDEGSFVICSCWLVQCLAELGDVERAAATFDLVAARANDLGLLAEQIDRRTGEQLGNFPQALSHVGVITASAALDRLMTTNALPNAR